jgi:hypothetical protein
MATLTGQTIASTYDALLKVTDNGPITSSLKLITDGLGNNTALSLSNVAASINGNVTATSFIKSSGTSTQYLMADGSVSTLTNPITGTGTTNTLPKFTGASALGNSNITDTGSLITLGGDINISTGALGIGTTSLTGYILRLAKNITGSAISYGIRNASGVQSDVSTVYYFDSTGGTQAASFTLANLINYSARQGVIGVGSTVTNQTGFQAASSLIGATNNYGFQGAIPSGLNNYNLYMTGTAANYLAGDVGIGVTSNYVSSGPILTTTLTSGGSGYVDATYTDVAATASTGSGVGALFTVVVSGGIVTSATLTWGGANFRAGDTATISNTLLGGTGSGLVITVATVDSSQLKIANANGGDITLSRADATVSLNDNIGSIKFEGNDTSTKSSGIYAEISALGASTAGGGYLSFLTRSATAGSSLVEGLRVLENANVFIPTTALGIGTSSLVGYGVRVTKTMGGTASPIGFSSEGTIQSDATSVPIYFRSISSTAAASFTTSTIIGYEAEQGTFGAGSVVTNQYGFRAKSTLVGATNNYGFIGQIPAQANTWNLYMSGTASNYMAGRVGIGSTSLTNSNLNVGKTITGLTTSVGINQSGQVQSDVTASAYGFYNSSGTQATAFTLSNYLHYACDQGTIGATSAITTQTGFQVGSTLIGATNNYGFRGTIPSGTNRWNIYMDGTANNYLAGSLGISSTGLGQRSLSVTKAFVPTSGTSYFAVVSDGQISTGNTVSAQYYRSVVSQASGISTTDVSHYTGVQGTVSGTITNQYGFFIDALTAGTNNYGFYGLLSSGTGRWNLYMAGTAANYLNGTTLIGTTTDNSTGAKLQVNGGITYVNIFNRQTASYTLVLTDQNDIIEMNVASANNLTIPLNATVAFPIGTEIAVLQYGAGQTTIVATVGVTLRAKANALKISGQFAGCTLVKVGTDEWYVIGDLTA